jgi:hypothetical protein
MIKMKTKYTKEQIDEMKEMLANSEWEGLTDRDLREVLWDGCTGWNNMPDEECIEQYENVFGTYGERY